MDSQALRTSRHRSATARELSGLPPPTNDPTTCVCADKKCLALSLRDTFVPLLMCLAHEFDDDAKS
jgi:hypothetical protein